MVYPLYNNRKKSRARIPPKSVFRIFPEKRKTGGENHGKRTLDQRVGSEVYHCKRTHDLMRKSHIEKKTGADEGRDQPRKIFSVAGWIEPKGTSFASFACEG